MHWVDRGPEPGGLEQIRAHYTPRWIRYYSDRVGAKPVDSRWRDFHDELEWRFSGLCAYCEEICKGEVDHFQPKSRFPESVYVWSNWLFACHDCNHSKGEKWPDYGYVDPCAESERPECYFTFDTLTGEMLPKRSLSPDERDQAQRMIDDLNLNARQHLRKRSDRLKLVSAVIPYDPLNQTPDTEVDRRYLASRATQLSGITQVWLSERGYPVDD